MDDGHTSATRVLWAGADPPDLQDLPPSVRLSLECEADFATATSRARTEPFDALVANGGDLASLSALLDAAAGNRRIGRRMVASNYADLPELVRVVGAERIQRVLAKPVSAYQLARAVIDAEPTASVIRYRALNAPADLTRAAIDAQLRELVRKLVELPATVIRPIAPKDPFPRLQLVVSISDPFQDLRRELPAVLGWPLKANGSAMGRAYNEHPIRQALGNLRERQEVYCLGREDFAYVAFFPWQDDLKVTVVVGFEQARHQRIADLHAHAVAQAREFPLPTPQRHSPEMFYDPDYDWVITKNYVGPDRRRTSTSLINRYTFRGRRKALMPNEFSSVGTFVDIAPRWVWITAAVFATLFVVDTAMTAYYVGGGQIGELNPLMRWALERSPVFFWAMKSALVVAATFVVMRWHLWKPGRWLFAGSIAVYAVLDLYWVLLYFTRAV